MDDTSKRTLTILLVIVLVAAILTVVFVLLSNKQAEKVAVEEKLAELEVRFSSLASLEGEAVAFDPLDDEVKVVMHWASWCASCIDELKALQSLAETLNDDTVGIYAFNRGDAPETARAFLETFDLNELSKVTYIIDQTDAHFAEVGGYTMPETIIYNGDGDVVEHIRGPIDQAILLERIKELKE